MNRINDKGLKALEFKKELLKDYPKIVKESLIIALDQLVESKNIDLNTYLSIKNDNVSYEEFLEHIQSSPAYMKTYEELLQEFEVLREKLNELFADLNIDNEVETKSVVENDNICVTKKYFIDKNFVIDYFGVEEKDLEKLMKRKGFVEKFAVLRLNKIFTDFISKTKVNKDLFNLDISYVYYDLLTDSYNIDLVFDINVEKLENDVTRIEIAKNITDIINEANNYYKVCMS